MKKMITLASLFYVLMAQATPLWAANSVGGIANGNHFFSAANSEFDGTVDLSLGFFNSNWVSVDFYIESPITGPGPFPFTIDAENNTGIPWSGLNVEISPLAVTFESASATSVGLTNIAGVQQNANSIIVSFSPFENWGAEIQGEYLDMNLEGFFTILVQPTAVPIPAAVWMLASVVPILTLSLRKREEAH